MVIDIILPRGRALRGTEFGIVSSLLLLLLSLLLAVCTPASSVPHLVIVLVVVHGCSVVHAIIVASGAHSVEGPRVENVQQGGGGGWWSLGAAQELPRTDGTTVQLCVGIFSLDDGAALQADAGEQALGLAVTENTGDALEGGGTGSFGIAPHRAGGERDVAAEGQGAGLREGPDGGGVVEDKDEVGELEAYLTTEAGASGRDGGWGGPGAVGEAGNDEAGAETSRAEEASFDDGEDCKSLFVNCC